MSAVVLFVQDGLDGKGHQRVATDGHFFQGERRFARCFKLCNQPGEMMKCQFIHILGCSLARVLLRLNFYPPALRSAFIPAEEWKFFLHSLARCCSTAQISHQLRFFPNSGPFYKLFFNETASPVTETHSHLTPIG